MSADTETRGAALRQLREAVSRGARVALIPLADLLVIRTTICALRDENGRAIQHAPLVESACRRLLDGLTSDALRLASTRDVDTLLTYNAARRSAA